MESRKFFFSWLRCFIWGKDGFELDFCPFRIGGNDQTLRNMLNKLIQREMVPVLLRFMLGHFVEDVEFYHGFPHHFGQKRFCFSPFSNQPAEKQEAHRNLKWLTIGLLLNSWKSGKAKPVRRPSSSSNIMQGLGAPPPPCNSFRKQFIQFHEGANTNLHFPTVAGWVVYPLLGLRGAFPVGLEMLGMDASHA